MICTSCWNPQRWAIRCLLQRVIRSARAASPKLLDVLEYRRQVNRKTLEDSRNPDRDAQFEHINEVPAFCSISFATSTALPCRTGCTTRPGRRYAPQRPSSVMLLVGITAALSSSESDAIPPAAPAAFTGATRRWRHPAGDEPSAARRENS
jgi:hypothetical protein